MGHEATPWRGGGPAAKARALQRAALDPDLEKHVGHDLNPLEDGDAARHRSTVPTIAATVALARRVKLGVLNKSLGLDRPPS